MHTKQPEYGSWERDSGARAASAINMNARGSGGRAKRGARGAALPMVLGTAVVLTIVGGSLLSGASAGRMDTIRRQQSLQCFWGAESALALARHRIFTDAGYRAAPVNVAFTNGLMRAEATVSKSGNAFAVAARGSNTANRIDRKISQRFFVQQYRYWDDFAIFAGKNGINLLQSIAVFGDVYTEGSVSMSQSAAIFASLFCEGNLTMDQSAAVYEEAYIGGTIDLGGSSIVYGGSYPFSSPANPYIVVKPEVPALDTTSYDALLAQASIQNSGIDFSSNVVLGSGVHYVQGGVTLQESRSLTASSPGAVLVVRDGFEVKQNAVIGTGVTVICGGKFWMGQDSVIQSNCTIYSATKIEMKQSGIIATGSNFVTPGTLDFKQSIQASGMFYAGNTADISQGVTIRGIILAKNGAAMGQTTVVVYNPNVLPHTLPTGIQTNDAVVITPQAWREL